MTIKTYLTSFFLCALTFGFSQDMQKGFSYLETGAYEKAENYFESVLKEYPDSKTAKLCYGRSIGLNGNAADGKRVFIELLEVYPEDFEIKLNYAEALLWNNEFKEANTYYKTLITENDKSFPAFLGYANSFSNLKEYEEALTYINKALAVSPGNPNALISKKYIHLGAANADMKGQHYDTALKTLQKNLVLFENDKETQLNIANLYLITDSLDRAEATYKAIAVNPKDSITALNGLALVAHLKGKEKKALKLSEIAKKSVKNFKEEPLLQYTNERYIQALIWNKKYGSAKKNISKLDKTYPNKNWVLALKATLNTYLSNFKKGVNNYNQILKTDSLSFDGNLGKANSQKALGLYKDAYGSAYKTLDIFTKQKDATKFINDLDKQFTPFSETNITYGFDSGENTALSAKTRIEIPTSTVFKWLANYGVRTTNNTLTNIKATTHSGGVGLQYQMHPKITFKGDIAVSVVKTDTTSFTKPEADFSFRLKPFKMQILDIGYKRELQNFNTELLNRQIIQNNFYATYNLNTNFNLGWYTQYIYTTQNDDNIRNLLFTSLFYSVLSKPALKFGVNYQYFKFKTQLPSIYFSPSSFNVGEVFVNLSKNEAITKPKDWFYELIAATGYQFIEENARQSTYRLQGKLGYVISNRSYINLYGSHSNSASATVTGFTFTEVGLRFKWLLSKAPLFNTKAFKVD
jgi:tetratricopeptide (TPR) repeat protein